MHQHLLSHFLLTYLISSRKPESFHSVPTLQKYLRVEKTNVRKVRNTCERWQNVTPNPVIITLSGLYLKSIHPNAHLCIHLFMRESHRVLSEDNNNVLLLVLQLKYSRISQWRFQETLHSMTGEMKPVTKSSPSSISLPFCINYVLIIICINIVLKASTQDLPH